MKKRTPPHASEVTDLPVKKKRTGKEHKFSAMKNEDELFAPIYSDELDLKKEMHPLQHYVDDSGQLVEELFSAIRGPSLKKLLPPILKKCPIEELKLLCKEQLEVMSKKCILHILSSEEMVSSLGTEKENIKEQEGTEEENIKEPEEFASKNKFVGEVQAADSTSDGPILSKTGLQGPSDNENEVGIIVNGEVVDMCVDQEEVDNLIFGERNKKTKSSPEKKSCVNQYRKMKVPGKGKQLKETNDAAKCTSGISSTAVSTTQIEEHDPAALSTADNPGWLSVFTKTQMEILELEMRARAIKALMRAQGLEQEEEEHRNEEVNLDVPLDMKGIKNKKRHKRKHISSDSKKKFPNITCQTTETSVPANKEENKVEDDNIPNENEIFGSSKANSKSKERNKQTQCNDYSNSCEVKEQCLVNTEQNMRSDKPDSFESDHLVITQSENTTSKFFSHKTSSSLCKKEEKISIKHTSEGKNSSEEFEKNKVFENPHEKSNLEVRDEKEFDIQKLQKERNVDHSITSDGIHHKEGVSYEDSGENI
ncbi:caspase activity and apoptosis inhibitor 1-like [Limulus polyphemus]|uniref:Caspase activity and apoptosis inhibitor 1-like n=1 Tax=Limulus polyphemus TaxID=6850 RepID=A0ABM1S620_LIMPO|nr:caspase activity and apoptosis inhibitor 1-like [Limulus polyphemus]XP_013772303.1 caspase activity and apoptosis inhibitor 1-like [Limulus polyphemus]XP_013772304.1 caspase activity and apoptosis inhibitor 1-like [Limulus polyphemus]XP_013772305.1 caspase activity and apoptosis inhibitor 1-like [Limulus polyphemus]XP_013772308.1 caspase activity and apoptosis inhibitor 1-like [Limulus polyphemus]XP_022239069.1 caspase activity and apoptosis inhibitor 1-like [Limulus polyphemus]XP_02223907